jgi:hypothetical protein
MRRMKNGYPWKRTPSPTGGGLKNYRGLYLRDMVFVLVFFWIYLF